MHVAMALPDPSLLAPPLDDRGQCPPSFQGPCLEPVQPFGAAEVSDPITNLVQVFEHGGEDGVRGAEGAGRVRPRHLGMEGRDPCRQAVHQARGQGTAVEQGLLGKALHLDRIFEGRTDATHPGAVRGAGDGHHAEIETGGQSAIEPNLLLAALPAPLQGGEVQKTQVQRLHELEGAVPDQKDVGDVRFDMLDRAGPVSRGLGVGLRSEQSLDQAGKGFGVHGG